MEFKIAVLKGDGIGAEIIDQAIKVLETIEKKYGHRFEMTEGLIGGDAIDICGDSFPPETVELVNNVHAVMLGAVGGPKWDYVKADKRPESGLLRLRKELGTFANIRPIRIYENMRHMSPLKDGILKDGVDIVIVRELMGGIYFGERGMIEEEGGKSAYDVEKYSEYEIERIAEKAFEIARSRKNKVTLVDKANVLESSRLWRQVVKKVHKAHPKTELEFMYVDNAAMQLIKRPSDFDVILTNNIFGDILSDEASVISSSIGLLPSASIGGKTGLYEPIHGSAPDIEGKGIANPIGTILSAAMMMRESFGLEHEASEIERAVEGVLEDGFRTMDILEDGKRMISTSEMGDEIAGRII